MFLGKVFYKISPEQRYLVRRLYYIHKDNLGSFDKVTNESGAVVDRYSFDAWGNRRNYDNWTLPDNSTHLFSRGYTGHEHLDKFGLINMNGRLYDSKLGRFLSPDPVLQDPSNTQNYNRYSYCLNNPFAYTDPSGYTVQPNTGIGFGQSSVGSPVSNNYGWESNYDQSFNNFNNWLHGNLLIPGASGGGNSVINNTTYNNFQIFITTSSFSVFNFDFYYDKYSGILKYYNNNAIGSVVYTPDPIVVNFNLLFFERNSGSELIFDESFHYLYPDRHNDIGRFPLDFRVNSYMIRPGRFGDTRGERLHAGCDLYAPVGTNVYATKSGTVIQNPYNFNTKFDYAVEIDHGDFQALYGEIIPLEGIVKGKHVNKGQLIGHVAYMPKNKSMLHFEMYSGDATGPFTIKYKKPYWRRSDLINPTQFLNSVIK